MSRDDATLLQLVEAARLVDVRPIKEDSRRAIEEAIKKGRGSANCLSEQAPETRRSLAPIALPWSACP